MNIFDFIYGIVKDLDVATTILISFSLILISGFFVTRFTKKLQLPKVSGYILAGILIDPSGLHLIHHDFIVNLDVISVMALSFIAFDMGRYFKRSDDKKEIWKVVFITLCESLFAGLLVTLVMLFVFKMKLSFSLLLGAIATATAPASTIMTIKEYNGKGPFVDLLLRITAFDDVVCLFVFSIMVAVVNAQESNVFSIMSIARPIGLNAFALVLGFLTALCMEFLITEKRSFDNRLILAVAFLFFISGICSYMEVSPLLACMVCGAVYYNRTNDKTLFDQMNNFSPPVMSSFFIISGMNMDLSIMLTAGVIGVAYFFIRIIGKYFGAYTSCKLLAVEKKVTDNMGFALMPQAGVAIGLAFMGKMMLPEKEGLILFNIILASSVLYELMGPITAKIALIRAGAIDPHALTHSTEHR
ncbi:MAG: cation:proton antiporter [Treponema sp.]|uniref:cation:proton antiporter n=1 Tax=Treponema sp. TaxID=166 RepID=UPI003FA29FC6